MIPNFKRNHRKISIKSIRYEENKMKKSKLIKDDTDTIEITLGISPSVEYTI